MHPILFHIPTPWGAVPIYSYGVMLGTSLLFGWYFIMWAGKKTENFNRELLANTFTVAAISAIVGSRILYVLTNLDEYQTIGQMFQIRSGGLVAYGGFIGGFLGSWVYLRMKKVPLAPWADLVAPTLGSGLMITRLGCYLYGCDYGKPLQDDAPAFLKHLGTFPKWDMTTGPKLACDQTINGSPAFQHHLYAYADKMIGRTDSLPVHPTQLYESLAGLVLFVVGVWVLNHRKFRGQVFIVVSALYSIWRFFIEMLRDDPERGAAFGFSTSQLIAMAILPVCAFAYVMLKKRAEENGEPPLPKYAQDPTA
ncbi:MAG: prolipoprotein diacylglyceryl transferase [Polyangiales bacterium]